MSAWDMWRYERGVPRHASSGAAAFDLVSVAACDQSNSSALGWVGGRGLGSGGAGGRVRVGRFGGRVGWLPGVNVCMCVYECACL